MTDIVDVKVATTEVLSMLPPYPIVLVTTRTNVITINQVSYFTFSPLRIGVAVSRAHYTHGLLLDERAFVVNVPAAHLIDVVKQCGSLSGRDGDKFVKVNLTHIPAVAVNAVRIRECGAYIECQVDQMIEFEHRTWFIGKVVAASMKMDHKGTSALMCGRHDYRVPGDVVAQR